MNIQEQLDNTDQLVAQGNFPAAISACRKIIDSAPECEEAWLLLGLLYGETGEITQAVEHVEKAIEIDPEYSSAHMALGQIKNATGDMEAARLSFIKATECDPLNTEALVTLASFYQQQNQISDAIQLYKKAVEIDDSLGKAWSILGSLHFHNLNPEAAEQCYKKAMSIESNDPTHFLDWCSFLVHTSRSEQALEILNQLPIEARSNPEVLLQFALASSKEGSHTEALKYISEAIDMSPLEKYILAKVNILQINGDFEHAFELLKPYVEINPPNHAAVIVLTSFCRFISLEKECMTLLDRVLDSQQLSPYQKHEAENAKAFLSTLQFNK